MTKPGCLTPEHRVPALPTTAMPAWALHAPPRLWMGGHLLSGIPAPLTYSLGLSQGLQASLPSPQCHGPINTLLRGCDLQHRCRECVVLIQKRPVLVVKNHRHPNSPSP